MDRLLAQRSPCFTSPARRCVRVCALETRPFLCERAHVRTAATCHLPLSVSCAGLTLITLPSPRSKSGLSHFANGARKPSFFIPLFPRESRRSECDLRGMRVERERPNDHFFSRKTSTVRVERVFFFVDQVYVNRRDCAEICPPRCRPWPH